MVRDHIPLEQGLRLTKAELAYCYNDVRDHTPLEQGLRQWSIMLTQEILGYLSETIFH